MEVVMRLKRRKRSDREIEQAVRERFQNENSNGNNIRHLRRKIKKAAGTVKRSTNI
jgi:hypothetical protein